MATSVAFGGSLNWRSCSEAEHLWRRGRTVNMVRRVSPIAASFCLLPQEMLLCLQTE